MAKLAPRAVGQRLVVHWCSGHGAVPSPTAVVHGCAGAPAPVQERRAMASLVLATWPLPTPIQSPFRRYWICVVLYWYHTVTGAGDAVRRGGGGWRGPNGHSSRFGRSRRLALLDIITEGVHHFLRGNAEHDACAGLRMTTFVGRK